MHGLTMAQLAARAGMKESTLCQVFRRGMGLTVKQYLNALIVQRAQEMLLSPILVKEIAWRLRFQDEYYFSRFFKRHVGLSPNEYRGRNTIFYG